MIFRKIRKILVLVIFIFLMGCQTDLSVPSPTQSPVDQETLAYPAAPADLNKSGTPAQYSGDSPTSVPTPSVAATLTSEHIFASELWFPIPAITQPESITASAARLFVGFKIPPLLVDLSDEFDAAQPYGEVPSGTISYHIFLVRSGNARMLWLGIPSQEIVQQTDISCKQQYCQSGTHYQLIYDAIPLPPTQPGDALIPFICTRKLERDLFLIVIAAAPKTGSATDIRYAWRIDQSTLSLQTVSTQDIECSPDW
jgi:hypothetical protein